MSNLLQMSFKSGSGIEFDTPGLDEAFENRKAVQIILTALL